MTARLGLGLIGIGRPWPTDSSPVPSTERTRELLRTAHELGIRVLDTAPAYGASEAQLGEALHALGEPERKQAFVATKCGEWWTPERGSFTDHSPRAIEVSARASVATLGSVDLLQIHKATVAVVSDDALLGLLTALAAELGIAHLGVSAKDVETCEAALASRVFDHIQCPVNPGAPELAGWAERHCDEVTIVANRPYGSGSLLRSGRSPAELLSYVTGHIGDGIVLTGTTDPRHLRQTHEIFSGLAGA